MKSATIPPLRVTPELRQAAENVLRENESLSAFVEGSIVRQVEFREMQKEFIARGLASSEESKRLNNYISREDSLAALDAILESHRGS